MISLSPSLAAALASRTNKPVELYEITFDDGTVSYFSTQAITWNGHAYQPYVTGRSSIKRYMRGQFDGVTVRFSNVDTGMAQFLALNDIEGALLVIRKIDGTVSDDSLPLFVGLLQRPGGGDENEIPLVAVERVGSLDMDTPARKFSLNCGWAFKGPNCLYSGGAADCDHSWSNCATLANTDHFGGFRFLPHAGVFQYTTTSSERFLLFFSREKRNTISVAYAAANDTPYDTPLPLILGRVQIQGIPIQHEDAGTATKVLSAFGAGAVSDFVFARANNTVLTDIDHHWGSIGGLPGQTPDPRFPDSYPYSRTAYLGVTVPSSESQVDGAPDLVAVIRGLIVDFFGPSGNWDHYGWSDSPIWNTREFLALSCEEGGLGIPWGWIDDARNYAEAQYCDQLIENATNDQKIYLPSPMPEGLVEGDNYRRFQSTGVSGADSTVDGPYSTFEAGVDDDTSRAPDMVMVKRFTLNVALAQQQAAADNLQKTLLPAFRGYIKQGKTGKIQICAEKANPHTSVTAGVGYGAVQVECAAPSTFAVGDLLIASTFTVNAEVLTVTGILSDRIGVSVTTKPHSFGDELLKISRAYDNSNVAASSTIQYPLSDRQSSANRITVKYVDAPAGFEARPLAVNDYEAQARVKKINNEDVDGTGIDSYFQAWRIGEWQRALYRDLGKFISLRAGITASDHEVGDDIIAVSAPEHGLQCVPFRIIELGFDEDDEVDIVGQLYSTDVYDDQAPQTSVNVPAIFAPLTSATVDLSVPPQPLCDIASTGRGTLRFTPITFASMVNTTGITSAVVVLLAYNELIPPTALLTTGLDETALSGDEMAIDTDTDLTGMVFKNDWLLIGGEMLFVTADATGSSITAKRALGLTAAENHAVGDEIHRLTLTVLNYSFPVGFFLSGNAGSWGPTETLPDIVIALMNIIVYNSRGVSPDQPLNYSQSVDGLRRTGNLLDGAISYA